MAERCLALGIPAFTGLMFGHINDFKTVTIGGKAEVDVEAGSLTLLEQTAL